MHHPHHRQHFSFAVLQTSRVHPSNDAFASTVCWGDDRVQVEDWHPDTSSPGVQFPPFETIILKATVHITFENVTLLFLSLPMFPVTDTPSDNALATVLIRRCTIRSPLCLGRRSTLMAQLALDLGGRVLEVWPPASSAGATW
jgi:hypothetical protein